MCSQGKPATGRMCTRGPTTSVIAGATNSSALVSSSCQPRLRRAGPSSSWLGSTATVSTSKRVTTWAMSSTPPSTGSPLKASKTGDT
jgi:hypothetical protein